MKRTLFFMLLSAWLSAPAAWAYDFDVDGIYYNITSSDDKTVEVTRGNYSGDVTIPETVTNEGIEYRVTAIGEKAFCDYWNLTSVTIPNSVTSISEGAFYRCTGLTSVTIPESVTAIGDYAFADCTDLMSVTIGDGVTTIGKKAFRKCYHLTSITIGKNVQTIGNEAFYGCYGLMSVTIPESVQTIGNYAFDGCRGLTSVTIGKNVTTIGNDAFSGCHGLMSVTIPESVQTIGNYAFSACTGLTSVTIPESVSAIGDYAFADCTDLMSVTVYNLTPVNIDEKSVFYLVDCDNCTLYVPAESIALYKAAEGWKNFLNIKYKIDGIGYDILSSDERTAEVINGGYSGDIVIPETMEYEGITYRVTAIGDYAFLSCKNLTSVTIPGGVTAIGDYAFEYCYALTSVTIPESVTSIGEEAFYGCSGLTEFKGKFAVDNCCLIVNDTLKAFAPKCDVAEYTIPDDVKVVGGSAFSGCSSLTSVMIPNSVTAIGGWAFAYCTGLTSVTAYNPEPVDINIFVFNGVNCANCKLYVPKGSEEAYRNYEGWSEFGEILPIVAYDFEAAPTITPVENDETITALSTFTLTFDERPALVGDSAAVMKTDSSAYYPARITASEDGKSFIITLQGDEQTKAAEYSLTEAGTYLLVIPAGTFGDDVFAADPKTGHSNPELTYTYTIKAPEPVEPDEPDKPSSITETQQDAGHITVYNLQGVPVLETDDAAALKTLQNGAYIVNGKKMIIVR